MIKKFFSVMVAIMILLIPFSVGAETVNSGNCGENLIWTLDDSGTLTVNGNGDMYDYSGDLDTPWQKEGIRHVVICDGVTSVGDGAFFDCYDVESVTIANSVKKIGYQAFNFCEKLSQLSLGSGIEILEDSAFSWCSSLTSVTIPASVRTMSHNAFSFCDSLKTVVIEEGVPYIYNGAFTECTSLEEVTIPLSVKSIGAAAFGYCTSLSKINYAGTDDDWNKISIEGGNESLISLRESGTTYVGDGKCGENLEWNIEGDVLTISGTGDMYNFDLLDAALPWYSRYDVTSIVIEEGVTSIGAYTFWADRYLESVIIPASVKKIETYAFGNCDLLKDVYYIGSESDWKSIEFAELNPYIREVKVHYLDNLLNFEPDENKIYTLSDEAIEDAFILVVLYDENGAIVDVVHVSADIAKGINSISVPIDDYSGAVSARVLGWKNSSLTTSLSDDGRISLSLN